MSEYQFVAFQAVDRPLTEKELAFARTQSSRAEITRWAFTNEYHYGDFRGDPEKLLRGGFDVHLHYANYGIRRVMLRLPTGFPFPEKAWSPYVDGERVRWEKDQRGPGGILVVSPFIEAGYIDQLWSPEEYVSDVVQLRSELLHGDLRPLFTLWLCGTSDSYLEPTEVSLPPVPAGLGEASSACQALLSFFDIDSLTLTAAAETTQGLNCPDPQEARRQATDRWVANLAADDARQLLSQFLLGDAAQAKAEITSRIREEFPPPAWPVAASSLTLDELDERTVKLREQADARERARQQAAAKRKAEREERERQQRMKKMAQDPQAWLREADALVAERGTANYQAAAEILFDLREALGEDEGDKIVRPHAAHLAKSYPTLNRLKSSLKKRNLLP